MSSNVEAEMPPILFDNRLEAHVDLESLSRLRQVSSSIGCTRRLFYYFVKHFQVFLIDLIPEMEDCLPAFP